MGTKRLKCGIFQAKELTTGERNAVLQVQFQLSTYFTKENIVVVLLLTSLILLILIAADMQSIFSPLWKQLV